MPFTCSFEVIILESEELLVMREDDILVVLK